MVLGITSQRLKSRHESYPSVTVHTMVTVSARTRKGRNKSTMLATVERAQRYLEVVLWLLRDSVGRFHDETLKVVLLAAGSLLGQFAALAMLHHLAGALAAGKIVSVGFWQLEVRSMEVLSIAVVGLCITLLLAAFAEYSARAMAIELMTAYETFCTKRLIAILSRLPHPATPSLNELASSSSRAFQMLLQGTRSAGLALRYVLLSLVPFLQFIVLAGALSYLEPDVMLTLLVVLIAGFPLLYRHSLYGAESALAVGRLKTEAQAQRKHIIQLARVLSTPLAMEDTLITQVFDTGLSKDLRKAKSGQLKVIQYTHLTMNVLSILSIGAIVIVLSARSLQEGAGWEMLVVYLVGFRICFANLRTVMVAVTCVNRNYPKLSQFVHFVRTADLAMPTNNASAAEEVRFKVPNVETGVFLPAVLTGNPVGYITPDAIGRACLTAVWDAVDVVPTVARVGLFGTMRFVSSDKVIRQGALRRAFGLPKDFSRAVLADRLCAAHLMREDLVALPEDLDTPLKDAAWSLISDRLHAGLSLLAALEASTAAIALDVKLLDALPAESVSYFLENLKNRLLLMIYNACPGIHGEFGVKRYLLSDGQKVRGWASAEWLSANRVVIERDLVEYRKQARTVTEPASTPEEEEEDI